MADRDVRRAPAEGRTDGGHERVIDLARLERSRNRTTELPDWSVDVRDRPPDGGGSGAPRRGRRWPTVVAVVAVVAFAATAVAAITSYQRGMAWRDIALEQRARADALRDRVVAADADVRQAAEAVAAADRARQAAVARQEATTGQLEGSEDDVAALEDRIATLASEKARLEDELAIAGQTVQSRTVAADAYARCMAGIDRWLAAAPRGADGDAWQTWADTSPVGAAACDALR